MRTRASGRDLSIAVAFWVLLGAGEPLWAQAEPESGAAAIERPAGPVPDASSAGIPEDLDPTKLVFFNLRLLHDELGGGDSIDFVLLRRDLAIRRPRTWGPGQRLGLLRLDLPVGRMRVNGETVDGFGDLYAQALNTHALSRTFLLLSGLAFTLPTASEDELGSGKWQVAPTVIPLWILPRLSGFFYLRTQDAFSVAGDDARRAVHTLLVNPTFFARISRRAFLGLDSEALVDWERRGEVSWKSGLTIGAFLRHRRALWLKLEAPWGEHRRGDWALTASIAFRRAE